MLYGSELLKITDDPLSYAKEQVAKYNEEAKNNNQVSMELKINFAEKLKADNATASSSRQLNIGYFFLQQLYHDLEIHSFFDAATAGSKITFDPNTINRFLTCAVSSTRIPNSAHTDTWLIFMNSPGLTICTSCVLWTSWRNIMTHTSPTCLRRAEIL